jgi:hypothetical protein
VVWSCERRAGPCLGLHFASELTFCYLFAYASAVSDADRNKNALLIAASLIAAVRTAREEKILPTIPRLITRIDESVRLAEIMLKRIDRTDKLATQNRNALMVAASSIAAVRTAREEKIAPDSWGISNSVDDSVRLAEMVLKRIEQKE